LDAEAGRTAPVSAGLINGTAYRGGTQPPLDPGRVIAALRHLLDHPRAPGRDILAIAGPPRSVTDCAITGDLDALAGGRPVTLRQTGRVSATGRPVPPAVPEPRFLPEPAAGQLPPGPDAGTRGPTGRLIPAHLIIESLPLRIRACPVDHETGWRSQILIEATSTVPRQAKSRLSYRVATARCWRSWQNARSTVLRCL
jgi:hypothetical protein